MARRAWTPLAFLATLMVFGLLLAELPAVSGQKYERRHVMNTMKKMFQTYRDAVSEGRMEDAAKAWSSYMETNQEMTKDQGDDDDEEDDEALEDEEDSESGEVKGDEAASGEAEPAGDGETKGEL